jgi:hypothetical protein
MQGLIWGGAVVSVAGLCGLIWCIFKVAAAKRANLSDDDLRAVIQGVVPINLGALFLLVIGLMMAVIGVFLN